MDSNTPPLSWFATPEGLYTLVTSVNLTPPPNPNFLGSSAPTPSAQPTAPTPLLEAPPIPPPTHDTRLSIVSVRFPVKESGGLAGLGMSMGSLRGGPSSRGTSRGDNTTSEASPLSGFNSPTLVNASSPLSPTGHGGFPGITSVGSGNSGGGDLGSGGLNTPDSPGGAPLSTLPTPILGSTTPSTKKKALSSPFSIPTLSSLGSSGDSSASRPIRQFRGTSSTFVRSWEGLPLSQFQLKTMADSNAGKETLFGFYTSGKGVVWTEIGVGRPKDHLCRITFSAFPTCICVNQLTATHQQLDVVVGFATGDIFWFDPLSAKYTRLNKAGITTSSPLTSIQWLPPTPTANHHNYFISSHADGTMITWDRDREDWSGFVPNAAPSNGVGGSSNGNGNYSGKENRGGGEGSLAPVKREAPAGEGDILVTRPSGTDKKGVSTTKFNPVSHWAISKKAVKSFAFSPDAEFCAVVGDDGCLRIIDMGTESLLETFAGYFGSLRCVSWSPDGRFVVTGGQDDLCTVYAPLEQRLVARCQGHSSFVTGVAWDPWQSDDTTIRFGSVSEDCKLILWDLSSAALSRPKTHHGPYNRRHSASSTLSLARRRNPEESAAQLLDTDRIGPVYHAAPRRSDVALLEPIMMKVLSQNDLFASLIFMERFIVTLSRCGQIKVFDRPPIGEGENTGGLGLGLRGEFAASEVRIDQRAR